jgi:hypothetical protein
MLDTGIGGFAQVDGNRGEDTIIRAAAGLVDLVGGAVDDLGVAVAAAD